MYKNTDSLKVKRWKKTYYANTNLKNPTTQNSYISIKQDRLRTRNITKNK